MLLNWKFPGYYSICSNNIWFRLCSIRKGGFLIMSNRTLILSLNMACLNGCCSLDIIKNIQNRYSSLYKMWFKHNMSSEYPPNRQTS